MLSRFFNLERIIHSFKTLIAVMIGFLLTKIIGFAADQWVVITIIVVMCAQIYVGSVLQKAYLRFLGTLVGCLFAAITIIFFGPTNLAVAVTIGLSSFIFSYMATLRENLTYAGTLGAVTTTIIMLGQKPTILFAVERFFEISLGILIATLVSQFILPINARTHLRRTQAETLGKLSAYYAKTIMSKLDEATFDYQELDENIVNSLLKQRQLAKESARERLGTVFDREHFMGSLYSEREMLRAITFMHTALTQIKSPITSFLTSAALRDFNETILRSLDTLKKAIESADNTSQHIQVPSLTTLKEEFQKSVENPSQEDLIYIDGFLFSAEMLTQGLTRLAGLHGVSKAASSQLLNTP